MIRSLALTVVIIFTAAGPAAAQPKIPILLDFDIGEDIDDTFALATVLASPELELRGVTTVGHDPVKRAQMTSRFLTAVGTGRKDFVAVGAAPKTDKPLAYWQVQYGNHASVAFRDPKPAKERAPEFIYKKLDSRFKDEDLTIVAIGPLTNIAKLLTDHPDAKTKIKRIVLMGGSVYRGYGDGSKPEPEWNIISDVKAAQIVFRSGIPLVVAPLDATAMVRLDAKRQKKLFDHGSLLTLSVQALVQLWREKNDPVLFDPVAVSLVYTEKFCTMENLALDVDDKGFTKIVKDKKPNARVATAIKSDEFLDWLVDRLIAAQQPSLPSGRIVNPAKMVPRGPMPNRVHVFEDFETDIEKRWWLAGRLATKERVLELNQEQCRRNAVKPEDVFSTLQTFHGSSLFTDFKRFAHAGQAIPAGAKFDQDLQSLRQLKVRSGPGMMVSLNDLITISENGTASAHLLPGSPRALRGVLTQDFDDRQGETRTLYTAVVFNPVPGPPMGKKTQLSFRYFLKGTDTLRVQLYSLSNGYHRCLTLTGLPQGKWQDGNVDMTQMRKPDGTGGPLSENERIDDIQFYCDPRAELMIDDIVLYDAAVEGEKRPFPKRFLFTAWFDSGKQGKEWPGSFEIAPKLGYFWNAAKSVPHPTLKETAWINVGLRGDRPVGDATALSFRYKLDGADAIKVALEAPQFVEPIALELKGLKKGVWAQTTVDFGMATLKLRKGDSVRSVSFYVPAAAQLLIDDLLLYEPARQK